MQQTLKLTRTAIEGHRDKQVKRLNDDSSPLLFEYHADRWMGSFYFCKKIQGRLVWRNLGRFPVLSVAEAREQAKALEHHYYVKKAEGVDIRQLAPIRVKTIGQLLNWYLVLRRSEKALSRSAKANITSIVQTHLLPTLGEVPIAGLDKTALRVALIEPILARLKIGTVQKVLQVLKQALVQAHSAGVINRPVLVDVKLKDFTPAKIRPKTAKLAVEHLPQVFEDMKCATPNVRYIMLFMLLFGTRLGETVQMRWQDINFKGGFWRIPMDYTKTKVVHFLPLTEQSTSLFRIFRLKRKGLLKKGPWCFSVPYRPMKVSDPNNIGKQIRTAARGHYTSHDLRKVMRSGLTELGVDHYIGELLLNHKVGQLEQTYIHTDAMIRKREALQRWHDFLMDKGLSDVLFEHQLFEQQRAEDFVDSKDLGRGLIWF